jgi:hypothetical protein
MGQQIMSVSGLRMYVDSQKIELPIDVVDGAQDLNFERVYYSRRSSGPIYRWLYERKLSHWRSLRVDSTHVDFHRLYNTSWKSVPETLQQQLGLHYSD